MKTCPQCKSEMKILKEIDDPIAHIDKTPIPFLVTEGTQSPIFVSLYVCPKCGLVQTYVEEEYMEHLKRL